MLRRKCIIKLVIQGNKSDGKMWEKAYGAAGRTEGNDKI
jgi:hypothetical protein